MNNAANITHQNLSGALFARGFVVSQGKADNNQWIYKRGTLSVHVHFSFFNDAVHSVVFDDDTTNEFYAASAEEAWAKLAS